MPAARAIAIACLLLAARSAHAEAPAAVANPSAALLEVLGGSGSAGEREAAAKSLLEQTEGSVETVEALGAFVLERSHASTTAARRKLLRSIGAAVPDKKGNFRNPRRQKSSQKKKEDQFDWMPKLLALPTSDIAVRELVADVAALRALAGSRTVLGGTILYRIAFDKQGMLYRDECGRYLRRMAPYSLPALVRKAAIRRKYSSARRYAKYQMERMDLESPKKAIRAAAGDEKLLSNLLETYGDAGYRPAVAQVLAHTNHDTPSIRAAARKGWMDYVTGKAPEAPKRKLVLPGGKTTNKEKPLYLNFRELARIELVSVYEAVFGELPNRRDKLIDLSKKLFERWDSERLAAAAIKIDGAIKRAADGDVAGAAEALDQLLALEDTTDRGAEIADVYLRHAKEQAEAKSWKTAAAAFRKVSAFDPEGAHAETAMASHYVALGRAIQSEGGDARALFAKASSIEPKLGDKTASLTGRGPQEDTKPQWMLYAGIGGGALAILLLILGWVRRRA